MTPEEIIELYNKFETMSRKEMTNEYNSLKVLDRIQYAEYLRNLPDNKETFNIFKDDIAKQAITDFWENERQLILNGGKGSRNWTPEQIEQILNFDENGNMKSSAGRAKYINEAGKLQSYQGHHLLNVDAHPEYAGDWRNIQPLTASEHISGAHTGNTHIPTNWYYDADTSSYFLIDGATVDFDNVEYVPKIESIFKSDADMRLLYADYDKLNNGQQYSLKYIDSAITQQKTIDELIDIYDYTAVYGNERFYDITVYIDDDGKLIQSSLTNLGETIDTSAKYSANIKGIKEFGEIKDVELARRIGDEFDGMTTAEKWQMKEYITYHTMIEDILLDPMNPAAKAA